MTAHLAKPDLIPAPDPLSLYMLERRFHEEFGTPSPPLEDWPLRKVADYAAIQRALDERDGREQAASGPAGSPAARPGASTPADVTEASFQKLRAAAKRPPMPPPD